MQDLNNRCFWNSHVLWESVCCFSWRFPEMVMSVSVSMQFGEGAEKGQSWWPWLLFLTLSVSIKLAIMSSIPGWTSISVPPSGWYISPSKISYTLSLRLNHGLCRKVSLTNFYPLLSHVLPFQIHIGFRRIVRASSLYYLKNEAIKLETLFRRKTIRFLWAKMHIKDFPGWNFSIFLTK